MAVRRHKKKRRVDVLRRTTPPGTLPGTLAVEAGASCPEMRVVAYGPTDFVEAPITKVAEMGVFLETWPVVWLDVEGFGDAALMRELGALFGIHALALEDVVNVHQRPKAEPYGDRVFFVTRMATMNHELDTEQVSLFLGKKFLLTFQQGTPGDSFEMVRHHIRSNAGALRGSGADYLCYCLIDAITDNYFPVLERLGDALEALETEALARPSLDTVSHVHDIKRQLLALRRIVWPMREALQTLQRDTGAVFTAETKIHLRDCHDHLLQIMDLIETYRELAAGLTDLYLSNSSNRMNEVMKVLTIIATVFMPLSFLASLYGMNFHTEASPWNMPELRWYWGYPLLLLAMALIVIGMMYLFWRQGWFKPTLPPMERHKDGSSRDDTP